MTPDQIKQLREMRQTTMTNPQIAAYFDLSEKALAYYVRKHKIPAKTFPERKQKYATIEAMHKAGHKLKDIAEAVGMSYDGVCHRLRKEGLSGAPRPRIKDKPRKRHVAAPVAVPDTLEERVFATKGRYADLAAIADRERMTLRAVTCLWHKVRTGRESFA